MTVQVYRADTGQHISYLDRMFDTETEARDYVTRANSKAWTPFFFILREVAA